MSETVNTFEHAGLTVQIIHDEDAYHLNPRDMHGDNFGKMVFWNVSGYELGGDQDETHHDEPDWQIDCELCEGSGWVDTTDSTEGDEPDETQCPKCEGNGYIDVTIREYFERNEDAAIIVPLYFADHGSSGTRMTRDDFDGCNGVIFLTKQELEKDYSQDWLKQQGCTTEEQQREFIEDQLMAHVQEYDDWGSGNVFGFNIAGPEDEDGGETDLEDVAGVTNDALMEASCWGFIGDYDDKYLVSTAKEAAESIRKQIDAELAEQAYWQSREVTTI